MIRLPPTLTARVPVRPRAGRDRAVARSAQARGIARSAPRSGQQGSARQAYHAPAGPSRRGRPSPSGPRRRAGLRGGGKGAQAAVSARTMQGRTSRKRRTVHGKPLLALATAAARAQVDFPLCAVALVDLDLLLGVGRRLGPRLRRRRCGRRLVRHVGEQVVDRLDRVGRLGVDVCAGRGKGQRGGRRSVGPLLRVVVAEIAEGPRTVAHVDAAQRKVDDRRVLLLDKVVLGKALRVEDQVRRQALELVPLELVAELL